jgi:signal transduction histidine kinase
MTGPRFDDHARTALARVTSLRRRAETAADAAVVYAVLTEALEEMSLAFDDLAVAQEELRLLNAELEHRVQERTAENARLVGHLREADRRKDEFLATLAHELRNPLAPIRNALEILRLGSAPSAPMERARAMIDRQTERLARLVDDLLDVSRVARGKLALNREPVDLAEAVERGVEAVAEHAKDRGVKVTNEPSGAAVRVLADPGRVDQILANLLTNAVKYTDRRGRVTVAVGAEDGFGVVRVRDTGVGIAPEVLPQVFELFVQSEQSAGHAEGGLGIGLHLVRELVGLQGGTVTAHSEGVGRGSEFVVRLPLVPPHGA